MSSLRDHIKAHAKAVKRQKSATGYIAKDGITIGDGWAEGWISKAVIDRSGEYVPADEWILDDHKKNPVGFKNHVATDIPPVRWEHPDGRYSIEKRAEGLFGRAYFNLNIPEGRDLYNAYKTGHMRGFSPRTVSDRPVRGVVNGRTANILRRVHLLEASVVGIPDNQDALVTSVKSHIKSSGNDAVPDGKVLRFGAFPVPNDTQVDTSKAAPKPGQRGFLDVFVSGLASTFADAKACLKESTPDERNEAYGWAGDAYVCAKSMVAAGRQKFADMPWDDAEKAIETEYAGFGDALKEQDTEDATVTEERMKALAAEVVAEQLKPVLADVAEVKSDVTEVKGHVDNHETALEGILETVESSLAS